MAIVNRNVTIPSGTSKLIATTGFGDPVDIINAGSGILYLGGSNAVTNVNGFRVAAAPTYSCRIKLSDYAGEIWGYADTANCDVRVLEVVSG